MGYKLQIFYKFTNTGNLLRQSLRVARKDSDAVKNRKYLKINYLINNNVE